jgi:DNA-binding transcriptional regulator YiaG
MNIYILADECDEEINPLEIINEIKSFMRKYNLSRKIVAKTLGIHNRTIKRWEKGETTPSKAVARWIKIRLNKMTPRFCTK